MNTLEITATLTVADWQAYQAAWAIRLQARSRISPRALLMTIAVALVLAAALAGLAIHLDESVPFLAVVIGAVAAAIGVMLNLRRMRTASQPDERGVVLGATKITFDAQGMQLEKPHSRIRHDWSVFQEVTQAPGHLFVWVDRVAALIVPVRDLPAGITASQAADQIRAFAAAADQATVSPHIAVEGRDAALPLTASTPFHASTGSAFLRSIGRFLTLRSADGPTVALSDRGILIVAVWSLGLWLLIDWLLAERGSTFYLYGFLGVGWYAAVVVVIAGLWARLSQPRIEFRNTLALALAFVPIAIALAVLIVRYIPTSAAVGALILLAFYASAYGHAGLRSMTSRHQPRAMFAGLLALSLIAWFAQTQYVTPQFWYPGDEESADLPNDAQEYLAHWRAMEPLLFGQAELIDKQIAAMERPVHLPAAVFFVGFAGMGEQRVFSGEIDLAAKVIDEKYGTAKRSLRLVNDQRDLRAHPFASPSALRRALHDIAQRMNLEQDVLFLALSSHGSEDGELSVSNGGVPVNNLDAKELADALNDAGIQWRVIIVSACYSGKYIAPLRNDRTIVITAAAADRTSFGCSDDRDLTYFGEAFYRDALPAATDLRMAFQHTKAAIAEREAAEDLEASNPQAHFGRAMERHLRSLTPQHLGKQ